MDINNLAQQSTQNYFEGPQMALGKNKEGLILAPSHDGGNIMAAGARGS